jgi:hypothetical protein
MDFMRRALSLSKSFAQASSCSISHVRHGVSSSARGGGVAWPFLGRLSTPFPPFFLSRRNLSFASGPPFLQSSQMPIKIYNESCRQFATRTWAHVNLASHLDCFGAVKPDCLKASVEEPPWKAFLQATAQNGGLLSDIGRV